MLQLSKKIKKSTSFSRETNIKIIAKEEKNKNIVNYKADKNC